MLQASSGGIIGNGADDRLCVKALDGIDLEIKSGDRIGVIGHNGSGKTSLLRTLGGSYAPTSGYLVIVGKTVSLLDVSLGMDPEATGYENIFLRGMILGMSLTEINRKMSDIADFSGLGDYLEMPMRTYSTGMQLRLAFSISTSVEADILILDEWLSVGDADFLKRANERLLNLVANTSILILATHSDELLRSVCNRAIELKAGKVIREFDPRAG